MPTLELNAEQIEKLVEQLKPEERLRLLMKLAASARLRMEQHRVTAEARLRTLTAERGLDWDALSEEQRIEFVDDLLHK